jgi:hypothetical protein
MGGVRLFLRRYSHRLRQPVAHWSENEPVIPPETFPATHGLHQKQGKQEALGQSAAAGTEAHFTSTVSTAVRRKSWLVGRVAHDVTSA